MAAERGSGPSYWISSLIEIYLWMMLEVILSSVAGGDIGWGPNLNYDLTVGRFLETLCIS